MTRDVVTVGPYTAVPDIAAIMADKHISGVPVVTDSGEIIGIVSESDLLRRVEIGTEREIRRKWWLGNLADVNTLAREYAKAHGLRAQDVMSRYVISVRASVLPHS
jgi:CBS-domain-containing membrane protein